MAKRELYVAEIKFKLPDATKIKEQLAGIESLINSTVKSIAASQEKASERTSNAFGVGPHGGLSSATISQIRSIRSKVNDELSKIGTGIDDASVEKALASVARTIGTTSERIAKELDKLGFDADIKWKKFADTGIKESTRLADEVIMHSILTDMFKAIKVGFAGMGNNVPQVIDTIIAEYEKLPNKALPAVRELRTQVERTFDAIAESGGKVDMRQLNTSLASVEKEMVKQELVARNVSGAISASFTLAGATISTNMSAAYVATGVAATRLSASIAGIASVTLGSVGSAKELAARFGAGFRFVQLSAKKAGGAIKNAFTNIGGNISNKLRSVKQDIEDVTPAAFDLRDAIASVEQEMRRMPDITTETFLRIRREFKEASLDAIHYEEIIKNLHKEMAVAADAGDASAVTTLAARLKKVDKLFQEAANGVKESQRKMGEEMTRQLDIITERFTAVGQEVDFGVTGMLGKFRQFRNGLSIMSSDGSSKLYGLREAIFGFAPAGNVFVRALDKMASGVDKYSVRQGKLERQIAEISRKIGDQFDALEFRTRDFGLALRAAGVKATFASQIKTQATEVEDMFERIQTSAESTGEVSDREFNRAKESARKFAKSLERLIKTTDQTTKGGKAVVLMARQLRQDLAQTENATRGLVVRLRKLKEEEEALSGGEEDLTVATDKHGKATFGLLGKLKKLLSIFKENKESAKEMEHAITRVSETAKRTSVTIDTLKGAFAGAFAGTLLANLASINSQIENIGSTLSGTISNTSLKLKAAFNFENGGDIVKNVFGDNFGNDVNDVAEAVNLVVARMSRLGVTSKDTITAMTEDAFRIRDAYGIDVRESLDAAQVLMKNFGLTSKQAMDFIANLSSRGVVGADAIDSITEYSTQIKNAGGNAETLFNLLDSGFQGAGTLGTDKAIDTFKEFRVRILDGSKLTKQSLAQLGIDSEDLFNKLSTGAVTVQDAFNFVVEALKNTDNRAVQMQAGVGLLGTQFEDMGNQAALALRTTGTTLDDMAGSTERLDVMYASFGSLVSAQFRKVQVALTPINQALLKLASSIMPLIMDSFGAVQPLIASVAETISSVAEAIMNNDWASATSYVTDAMYGMAEAVISVLSNMLDTAFDWGTSFITQIANGIFASTGDIINSVIDIANSIADYLMPGSPPKEGPLSTIDKWGGSLIDVFGEGWSAGDLSFIKESLAPVEKYFTSQFGKGGQVALADFKRGFEGIVAEINSTGIIDDNAFSKIASALGEGNTQLKQFLALQLQRKKAAVDVAKLETKLSKAIKSGYVSEKLRTSITKARVKLEATSTAASKASAAVDDKSSIGRISRATAKLGKISRTTTKKGIDNLKRYRQFLATEYETELKLLEDKHKAGEISDDEYYRAKLRLEERYVDASRRTGQLAGLEEHSQRIIKLREAIKQLKGEIGAGTIQIPDKGGDAGAGAGADKLGDAMEQAGADAVDRFGQGAAGRIAEVLSNLFDNIKPRLSEMFGKLTSYIKDNVDFHNFGILSIILGGAVSILTSPITNALSRAFAAIYGFLSGGAIGSVLKVIVASGLEYGIVGAIILGALSNWDVVVETYNEIMDGVKKGFGEAYKKVRDVATLLADNEQITESVNLIKEGFEILLMIVFQVMGLIKKIPKILTVFILIPIGEFVNEVLGKWSELSGGMQGISDRIATMIYNLANLFRWGAGTIGAILGELLSGRGFTNVGSLIAGFKNEMAGKDVIGSIIDVFAPLGQAIWDTIVEGVMSAAKSTGLDVALKDFFENSRLGTELVTLFNTIQENMAPTLAIIASIVAYVSPIIPTVISFLPVLGEIFVIVGKFSIVLGVVITAVKHFSELWPILENVLAGIVKMFTGVVEIVSGFFKLFSKDTFAEGVSEIRAGMTDLIGGLLETIINAGSLVAAFALDMVGDLLGGIASLLDAFGQEGLANSVRNAQSYIYSIAGYIEEMVQRATDILYGLVDQASQVWQLINGDAGRLFEALKLTVIGVAREIFERVVGFFKSLYDKLLGHSIIIDIKDGAINAIVEMKDAIINTITELATDFIDNLASLPGKIAGLAKQFIDAGIALGKNMYDGIIKSLGPVGEWLQNNASNITEPMSDAASNVTDYFAGMYDEVVGHSIVPDMVSGVIDEFSSMTSNSVSAVVDMRDSVSETMSDMAERAARAIEAIVREIVRMSNMADKSTGKITDTKNAIDSLSTVNTAGILKFFEDMYNSVKRTAKRAKDFRDYMKESYNYAKGIGDTLAGNVPAPDGSHASGAWNIPFDGYRAVLHKSEMVLPSGIATEFRRMLTMLSSSGISAGRIPVPATTNFTPAPVVATPSTVNVEVVLPNATNDMDIGNLAREVARTIKNTVLI